MFSILSTEYCSDDCLHKYARNEYLTAYAYATVYKTKLHINNKRISHNLTEYAAEVECTNICYIK